MAVDSRVLLDASLLEQTQNVPSKKRPSDSLEDDLAQLPYELSRLSVGKKLRRGHDNIRARSKSADPHPFQHTLDVPIMHAAVTTSRQRSLTVNKKGLPLAQYVHQRKRLKLEQSHDKESTQSDHPLLQSIEATMTDWRPKDNSQKAPFVIPGPRRSLIEIDGNNLHAASGTWLTDPPATLDGLPTELKLMVLQALPDMGSLEALIRASPLYSRAYFDVREEIYNTQTFEELRRRGVYLLPRDIDTPCALAWLEVSIIGGGPPPRNLGGAIHAYYNGLSEKKAPRLSISHCRALLTVSEAVGWRKWTKPTVQTGPTFFLDNFCLTGMPKRPVICPPAKVKTAYTRGFAHYHAYVFRFRGQPSFTLSQVAIFRKIFALIISGAFFFGPHRRNSTSTYPIGNPNMNEAQRALGEELAGKFAAFAYIRRR